MAAGPPLTIQQHILEEQRRLTPHASGDFSWLLSGITLAAKIIADQVRRAGLADILGEAGGRNVQGEAVQKLDVLANKVLLHCLGRRGNVAVMASEEDDEPIVVARDRQYGTYVVVFDPLDGSSNIDVNVSVGTIFSILRREIDPTGQRDPMIDVLQCGRLQRAAGYVVYGSSTMIVYTTGHGVHGFTLDPSIGAFILSHENIKMPPHGTIYSVNEANADSFAEPYRRFLAELRAGQLGRTYSSRYIGSLVADFHRTLLKGGVFLYPPTRQYPQGKLRLLYEANPIAFLAEQAGGAATDGRQPILDIKPESLHQRTPLLVGSREEMDRLMTLLRG
ncbi:MAG: class 1 fructose-bisphosphatase [Gemmataceae bacterium]|nr:class 1 fructose-bisphosphatase [Gemmataceae bacterium]MDW8264658.1 class 1 fructose-bisphosphatase [Gemmataceae bacterium]